ncbi:DUF1566 domain-containing protein [Polaromonas sp.]|uniref:DUF1566 domain-containing protein n=1 Tax=Polaromonas sp. TaxID=1869339 RepID=UPI003561BA76
MKTATDTASAPAATNPAEADANTPPAHGEYWPGQGGIYIYTMAASLGLPARHLIAAAADADNQDLIYGPYIDVPGATSQLNGPANTDALIAAGDDHTAAAWARSYTADGHIDFHLPSRVDLLMAYAHTPKHFNTEGWYLSSTQTSRNGAFVQDFADGYSGWLLKDLERRVRAFRWIQL